MLNRGLDKLELLRIVEAVANEKSIDKELVIGSMESAIQKAALTKFGNDNNIEVIIDRESGDIKIQKVLDVVERVEDSAREITLEDAIKNFPNKYETLIGENGVRLSGGEKQRLSIARAMMKKSSIILLDEATSSLDTETESKIQEALKTLTKDKTTIVIAHRLSTILNSNIIYVIDSGKVIASGKHDELINKSELYKGFYEKQIQK